MGIVIPMIAQALGQVRTWDELEVDISCLISNGKHLKKIRKSGEDYREKCSLLEDEVRVNQTAQQEALQKIFETFGQQVQKLEWITESVHQSSK